MGASGNRDPHIGSRRIFRAARAHSIRAFGVETATIHVVPDLLFQSKGWFSLIPVRRMIRLLV